MAILIRNNGANLDGADINNPVNGRIDYFRYLLTDPLHKSDWQNFIGYQAKGGANYNIDDHRNVFANVPG